MEILTKVAAITCAMISSLLLFSLQSFAGDEIAGVRHIRAASPERKADLAVTIWYPSQEGRVSVTLGESAFFKGTPSMLDAPIPSRKYPLILLSHGAGIAGTPEGMSWIAASLAKRGFIVAAPMHPGNGGANRSAAEMMKLWMRPVDITDTLNAVLQNEFFKEHVESGKVGVLGLSMGGNTALALAGARINPVSLAAYCDKDEINISLCGWIRQSGVDLHSMDLTSAGRNNRDARIKFAMAIDPAPVDVFALDSFSEIAIPVDLVNLGPRLEISQTIRADKVAQSIVRSSYSTIKDASHYSLFAECKPGVAESDAAKEIGDPICADGKGRSRNEIHNQLINMAATAFSRELNQ